MGHPASATPAAISYSVQAPTGGTFLSLSKIRSASAFHLNFERSYSTCLIIPTLASPPQQRTLLIWLADCLNPHLRDVINYRQEENRVRREQLGNTRLGLNDDQRRRGLHAGAGDLRLQQSPAAGAYPARHIVQSRRGLLPGVQL